MFISCWVGSQAEPLTDSKTQWQPQAVAEALS